MTDKQPNPGSNEAVDMGCTCPMFDNCHGAGAYIEKGEPLFWINDKCPIHSAKKEALAGDTRANRA